MPDSKKTSQSSEPIEGLGRREVIKGAAAAGLVVAAGAHPNVHAAGSHSAGRDLIERENAKPGTRDWLDGTTRLRRFLHLECRHACRPSRFAANKRFHFGGI